MRISQEPSFVFGIGSKFVIEAEGISESKSGLYDQYSKYSGFVHPKTCVIHDPSSSVAKEL